MHQTHLFVVGGTNMDILGCPSGAFALRDSVIGHVTMRSGGVGHNIASKARHLGARVSLLTAFGMDETARMLKEDCKADGLDIESSITADHRSSVYLAIHDENGDMAAAINDMALTEVLTPDALQNKLPMIAQADGCILDANLPKDTLQFLSENITMPLICDPVSCQKAERVIPILKYLSAIKPNLMEAQFLSHEETPQDAAGWFLSRGVRRVFISMGKDGVYYADSTSQGILSPALVSHTAQTGAGDAMTAGLAIALCRGADIRECAQAGMDAALAHLTGS